MKINEKNLCNFASSPPVDLEGFLNKKGEVNRSWQRRWFVLKGNLLFYFERKGDKDPIGLIVLEGCTIELAEESEQYCFQIIFHGVNNRTYFLSADNQTGMEEWMKALTSSSYEYMKLMVVELQRQLDEIEGCKDKTPENTPIVTPKAPPRRQNPFNKLALDAPVVAPLRKSSPRPTRRAPSIPTSSQTIAHLSDTPTTTAVNTSTNNDTSTSQNSSQTSIEQVSQDECIVTLRRTFMPDEEDICFEKIHLALGKQVMRDVLNLAAKIEQPLILL